MSITAFRLAGPARRQANPVCRCRRWGWDVIPKRLQDANDVRWQIEELHPGTKQLTKTEKCPCHKDVPNAITKLLRSCLAFLESQGKGARQNTLSNQ